MARGKGAAQHLRAPAPEGQRKGALCPPPTQTTACTRNRSSIARCLHRRFTLCVRAVSSQVSRIDDNVELRNRRSSITGGDSSAGQPGDDKAQPQYRQVRQDWSA